MSGPEPDQEQPETVLAEHPRLSLDPGADGPRRLTTVKADTWPGMENDR